MRVECAYDELVELHRIIENPKNPNKHSDAQIARLAKIIDFQGQRHPIIVSKRSGFVVAGHCRLAAIKRLGWEKAAVNFQEFENEAQEFAFVVSDNAIAEWSVMDKTLILDEFKELDIEYDLMGLKFDFDEVDIEGGKGEGLQNEVAKKWVLEVELPSEMELRDLYDDLVFKGHIVRDRSK